MKKIILFISLISCIPSIRPIVNPIQNFRLQDTGEMIKKHPYITFFSVVAIGYLIQWWFKIDADELEYQRIKEVVKRSRACYGVYRVDRPANFWVKPVEVEVEL